MIKRLINKPDEDEYVELDSKDEKKDGDKIVIQVDRLEGFADSERILNKLRESNIVLVKIKHLRDKDNEEFKRSMEKIKKACTNMNGEIGALGNDWILLTPRFTKVQRSV